MYISEVSGHHQATLAIEKSLRVLYPNVEILNINGFRQTYPLMEKIVNKAYMGIIKRTPKIWDYLYDNPKVVKSLQAVKEAIHKANHSKLARLFKEFRPDAVVCTQAFPCGMVADYSKTYNLNTRIVGVLTDYAPHSYWIHKGVDYYVVPSEDTGERLEKKGVPSEKIKAFGIPVDPKFTVKLDKRVIAQKLGFSLSAPIILIMGGGQGLGPIKEIVKSLIHSKSNLQMMILAGTNKKLIKWLKRMQSETPKPMVVFDFAKNVEELMEVATVAVTKPGGMTTTEALTKGLPMVIVNPIPGQEMHNTEFLLKKGVAIRVNRLEELGGELDRLLASPEKIHKMSEAAIENSKPNSSFDIARLILETHV